MYKTENGQCEFEILDLCDVLYLVGIHIYSSSLKGLKSFSFYSKENEEWYIVVDLFAGPGDILNEVLFHLNNIKNNL